MCNCVKFGVKTTFCVHFGLSLLTRRHFGCFETVARLYRRASAFLDGKFMKNAAARSKDAAFPAQQLRDVQLPYIINNISIEKTHHTNEKKHLIKHYTIIKAFYYVFFVM